MRHLPVSTHPPWPHLHVLGVDLDQLEPGQRIKVHAPLSLTAYGIVRQPSGVGDGGSDGADAAAAAASPAVAALMHAAAAGEVPKDGLVAVKVRWAVVRDGGRLRCGLQGNGKTLCPSAGELARAPCTAAATATDPWPQPSTLWELHSGPGF